MMAAICQLKKQDATRGLSSESFVWTISGGILRLDALVFWWGLALSQQSTQNWYHVTEPPACSQASLSVLRGFLSRRQAVCPRLLASLAQLIVHTYFRLLAIVGDGSSLTFKKESQQLI